MSFSAETQALQIRNEAIGNLPAKLPMLDAAGAAFMGRMGMAIAEMIFLATSDLDKADAELFAWMIGRNIRENYEHAPGNARLIALWISEGVTFDDDQAANNDGQAEAAEVH